MAAARAPREDYCIAPAKLPTCVQSCVVSNKDSVGAQLHHSFITLRSSLNHNCRYVHQDLVRGQNDIRSSHHLSRAKLRFRLGDGCISNAQINSLNAETKRSSDDGHGASAGVSVPIPTTKLAQTWAANGSAVAESAARLLDSYSRYWANVQLANGRGNRTECVLHGVPAADETDDVKTARHMEAFAAILRRLGNVSTPWFVNGSRDDANILRVAVHVRRGDLTTYPHWTCLGRWVPDSYYKEWLPAIASAISLTGRRSRWHIMSAALGDGSSWAPLQRLWSERLIEAGALGVSWHIDRASDFLDTLIHLLAADVLVLAESAYSRLAATYSLGVLISVPFDVDPRAEAVAQYPQLLPSELCLRTVHVLPAPPACSCLSNRTLFLMNPSNRERWKYRHPKAVSALGDAHSATPSWSDTHQCWLFCRSHNRARGGAASPASTRIACARLRRSLPLVPFANRTLAAEIDEHLAWKRSLGAEPMTPWTSASSLVAAQLRPFALSS